MVSWRPFPGSARSQRALKGSLVKPPWRQYQPRGVSRALPWRVARRRMGSLTVAFVRQRCPGQRCHRPSHGGPLDQGIPEEVLGGLVCVAVGWPAFVLL